MRPADSVGSTGGTQAISSAPATTKTGTVAQLFTSDSLRLSPEEKTQIVSNRTRVFHALMAAAGLVATLILVGSIAASPAGWVALGLVVIALIVLALRHQKMQELGLKTDTTITLIGGAGVGVLGYLALPFMAGNFIDDAFEAMNRAAKQKALITQQGDAIAKQQAVIDRLQLEIQQQRHSGREDVEAK